MKINRLVPIVSTEKLEESKKFYMKNFGFQVLFANDWYVLLESQDKVLQIAFVMPNHATQPPIFQTRFDGNGIFYTIEVDDADQEFSRLQKANAKIELAVRDEPWGERHFAVKDPNGVMINVSQLIPPTGEYVQ
ncbi:MAG: VOC family protein [Nitrosopumilus sp.]|uniref:VOC family protein n=1 Tax=Nitrosopumilus sp. TaxID=2024843 RepID=UPI00242E7E82|nr:VOC family protein [Nitrosopumilus sp.]MCV0366191.1 VOC family protein [Nitrosopumilus sp.]